MHRTWPILLFPCGITLACVDGPSSRVDADAEADASVEAGVEAGPDTGPDAETSTPAPPTPPAPPVFVPCPSGWREVEDRSSGLLMCDPWPEGGALECEGVDEAHFPGEPSCTRIGPACPSGSVWATDLPLEGSILYVSAGADEGGNGSLEAPFATVTAAVETAISGTTVAVGLGTYDEAVDLHSGITLHGACTARTVIASSVSSEVSATVDIEGREVELRSLRVGGARWGIMGHGSAFSVHLEDIIVDGAEVVGIVMSGGASLSARNLVIRDTLSRRSDESFGRGLILQDGANATVLRAIFERNRETGVFAAGAESALHIEDAVIRDTLGRQSDFGSGSGLGVFEGASATVLGAVFEGNHTEGILVEGAGTVLNLEDVLVQDNLGQQSDEAYGFGLNVQSAGRAAVLRARFERNRTLGVHVDGTETTLSLEGAVIRDTQSQQSDGAFGRGLEVSGGGSVTVTTAVIENNRGAGVLAFDSETTVRLEDTVVRNTLSRESDATGGQGLGVSDGANVTVLRALFEGNRHSGISVSDPGSVLFLEDAVIRDTLSQESDGAFGRGLNIVFAASATVLRAVFERNREASVVVGGLNSDVRLDDVWITTTLEQACASDSCEGDTVSDGLAAVCGGHAELRRFAVDANGRCGLLLGHGEALDDSGQWVSCEQGGTVDLHHGVVSNNAIGVNVGTQGFDSARLTDGVVWIDNGVDLDTSELPLPSMARSTP